MITGTLRSVRTTYVQIAIQLELLSAGQTAIQPEADAGKGGVRHAGMMQLNATIGVGHGCTDGIAAGMDRRRVTKIPRGIITPVLPAVDQRIGINGQITLRHGRRWRGQRYRQHEFRYI